jgi:hypothetical protein
MNKLLLPIAFLLALSSCNKDDSGTCPEGYTGENCSTQITPSRITMSEIILTDFPEQNWDTGSGPDLKVMLTKGSDTLYLSPQYYNDVTAKAEFSYVLPTPVGTNDMEAEYTLHAFDFDNGALEPMGSVTFDIYDNGAGFPTRREVDCDGCAVAFKVRLQYQW